MAKITRDVLKAVNDDINNLKAKKPLQNYKAPTPPAPALLQGIDRSVLSNINTDIGNMNAGNNLQFAQQPTPTPTPTVPEPTVNPQTAAIQSYLQSTQQTEEEKGLNTRIADITGQTLGGQTMIGGEPVSAGAMTGRKNYLSREALAQLQPLQSRVASLLANRTANQATTIGDTTYSPTGEALFTKPTEAESTKPVSLAQGATLVDPTTGKVIASGTPKPEDEDFSAIKSVQGGLYNIKTNEWVVTPEENTNDGFTGMPSSYKEWKLAGGEEVMGPYKDYINPKNENLYGQKLTETALGKIDELLPMISEFTTGYGSLMQNWPRSKARDFNAKLDTLKSNIAFGSLTEMRAASTTGGALGQVSDREGQLLMSALGALDQGQSPQAFREQLGIIKSSLQRWGSAVQSLNETKSAQPPTMELADGTVVRMQPDGTYK